MEGGGRKGGWEEGGRQKVVSGGRGREVERVSGGKEGGVSGGRQRGERREAERGERREGGRGERREAGGVSRGRQRGVSGEGAERERVRIVCCEFLGNYSIYSMMFRQHGNSVAHKQCTPSITGNSTPPSLSPLPFLPPI